MFGNTNTNTFGNLFGQTAQQNQQQPQQQTSGLTSFGGWAPPGTSGGFTTSTTGTNVFGTSTNTSGGIFGSQQNANSSTTTTPTLSIFGGGGGGTTTNTGFTTGTTGNSGGFFLGSSPNSNGTSIRFDVVKEQDTISKNGVATKITVGYQCISIMAQYKHKSLEELRYEDYQLNRHKKTGSTPGGIFSNMGTTSTPPPAAPPQPIGGLFGSILGQQQQHQPQQQWLSSGTQNTNTTTATSGLFSNLFNQNQQKPATNLFSSSSTFRSTTTTGAATSPFSFGATNTATTPQQGQGQTTTSTNFFGTPTTTQTSSTATTTPTFTFGQGTTGTTPTLNLFGNLSQQQQQQKPQNNGFNSTVGAANVTTTGPGVFGQASPSTGGNKPLFGTGTTGTTSAFGTGSTTPATPPSTGFFTAATQQQQNINTNLFGSFGTTGNTTANKPVTFGGTTNTAAPQQPAPTFGSAALGTSSPAQGTSTQQPSTSFGFNPTAPAQQNASVATQPQSSTPTMSFGTPTMFGNPSTIGTTGSSIKFATAPGTFGSTGGFVLQAPPPLLQAPRIPFYQHPQYVNPGPVTFGTSPFKDNPLFYNMHENAPCPKPGQRRKKLDMPPADESIQKYVSKNSSQHLPSNFTSLPLFRRQTCLVKDRNSSISKFKIFDGFEDEDFGVGIDILSPKTDVKKLNLQTLEESLGSVFPPETKSSPSLARRSTELMSEKSSKDIITSKSPPVQVEAHQACSSSSVLGNRRVRFLLPYSTKPGQEKDDGEDDDDNESFRLGSHFGSSSVSLLDPGTCIGGLGGAGDYAFLQSSGSDESIVERVGCSTGSFVKIYREPGSVCGLISSRDSYFVKPSLQQLDKLVDEDGNCFVEDFEIGRRNFGKIKFLCPVNVRNLNIDELVNFRHKEVVVYPDDNKKPGIGQGLNVPAEIRLERVWPVDKETNELIRGVDNVKEMGYEDRLRRSCKRMGVQFISYDAEDGIWCFRVTHF